ncbi:cAMP-responsive element modulator isoform X1 [Gadus morhua]|uniref:cAMP-responsive element modulator isoform X1 n=1 Tax=Gadus morhua TaxID=8049 RepID=UPI0011B4E798|nr:cAMP-responsive element modulator-like isoform X1 [Gadus morhua]
MEKAEVKQIRTSHECLQREHLPKRPYRRNQTQCTPSSTLPPPPQTLFPELLKVKTEVAAHPGKPNDAPVVLPTKHTQYTSTSGASIKGHPLAVNMTSYPPLSKPSPAGLKPPPNRPVILHSGKTGDGYQQFYLQTNSTIYPAATGDMSAYQLHTPASSLPQGVGMAHLHGPQKPPEVITQKRELRLMKNREAARECRRKKKEEAAKACRQRKKSYMSCLEASVARLEEENKKLRARLQCFQNTYSLQ